MNELQKQWYRQRIDAILAHATAYDVLRRNGVDLKQSTDDQEEQISCPFHGEDKKPSARVYPARDRSPSHVWCYVCQEKGWDAIGLWKKFAGLTFGQALSRLEREYELPTPERAEGLFDPPEKATRKTAFEKLYQACESRLLNCKHIYRKQGDMTNYLVAGSVLDRTKYRVENGIWTPEKGTQMLQTLLDRIRETVQECPEG